MLQTQCQVMEQRPSLEEEDWALNQDLVVAYQDEQLVVGHGGKEDTAGKLVAYILHMVVAGMAGADNGHVVASGKKTKKLLCCHWCLNCCLGMK